MMARIVPAMPHTPVWEWVLPEAVLAGMLHHPARPDHEPEIRVAIISEE
jgi:hypothetical protein